MLHVRPYPVDLNVDLNGLAKESTEAVCRRNLGGVGGCRGGGGRVCWYWGAGASRGDGCGECKVDEDKDVDVECRLVADVVIRHGGRVLGDQW